MTPTPTHPPPVVGEWRRPLCVFCGQAVEATSDIDCPEFLHRRGCWACPRCSRTRTRDTQPPVLVTAWEQLALLEEAYTA